MQTKRFVRTVEILVVFAVIGIVTAVLLQWLSDAIYKSYESVALQEAKYEFRLFYLDDLDNADNSYVIKVEKEEKFYYYVVVNDQFSNTLYESENDAKEVVGIVEFTEDLTKGINDENPRVEIFGKAK